MNNAEEDSLKILMMPPFETIKSYVFIPQEDITAWELYHLLRWNPETGRPADPRLDRHVFELELTVEGYTTHE